MKKAKTKWLIVANWKMNPVFMKEAVQIFLSVKKVSAKTKNIEAVVCPPFVYLDRLKSSSVKLLIGAQDLFPEPEGSFTGGISYLQLKNMGVKYVIVGHSERRSMGENEELINKKISASLKGSLIPILCIGEKERDEKGEYLNVVRKQISSALNGLSKNSIKDIVVAYEPIWAIGKEAKKEASTKDIFQMVIFIKKVISDVYSTKGVPPTKILYGGSVNEKNVESIMKESGVDGVLVGRVGLQTEKFKELLQIVDNIKK